MYLAWASWLSDGSDCDSLVSVHTRVFTHPVAHINTLMAASIYIKHATRLNS